MSSVTTTGVYYGFAQVVPKEGDTSVCLEDQQVYPMAMSLGWNPFYKNERLSAVSVIRRRGPDYTMTHNGLTKYRKCTSCMTSNQIFMVSR